MSKTCLLLNFDDKMTRATEKGGYFLKNVNHNHGKVMK